VARIVARIYNWWSLCTRLAIPNRHTEATTSRPLLLHGIGRPTTHGNQTTLTITSNHAPAEPIRRALAGVSRLLRRLIETAEQFKGQPTLAVASAVDFSRLAQKGCARSAISTADRLGQLPDLG